MNVYDGISKSGGRTVIGSNPVAVHTVPETNAGTVIAIDHATTLATKPQSAIQTSLSTISSLHSSLYGESKPSSPPPVSTPSLQSTSTIVRPDAPPPPVVLTSTLSTPVTTVTTFTPPRPANSIPKPQETNLGDNHTLAKNTFLQPLTPLLENTVAPVSSQLGTELNHTLSKNNNKKKHSFNWALMMSTVVLAISLFAVSSVWFLTRPENESTAKALANTFSQFTTSSLTSSSDSSVTMSSISSKSSSAISSSSKSLSTNLKTGEIKSLTYKALDTTDKNKLEQSSFVMGDPILICIEYNALSDSSQIQIAINKKEPNGAVDVLTTRFSSPGTSIRCLPFVGVEAKKGNYTIELSLLNNPSSTAVSAAKADFEIK